MNAQTGRSFYEALGIPPNAQKQDIKNAYRRLALRYHPDKNPGDSSAKALFQEIQAAYETLSEDDKRARYDISAGFSPSSRSTRAWREPSYGPCPTYTQDPPFWSVELRAMTIQKCARITRIQHLEREIREVVLTLDDLIAAENRAAAKETKKARNRFSLFNNSRAARINAQRQSDFLAQSSRINAHLDNVKNELRTALAEHRTLLNRDNERKTWWARERVRRVEEENRRAATTAAEAARRRAERAEREHRDRDRESEAAQAADDEREDKARRARTARAEEEMRRRGREDPEVVRRREREAREWVAGQRRARDGGEET